LIVELVIVIVAAAVIVGLVVAAVTAYDARARHPPNPNATRTREPNETPLAGAGEVIDRSIGMYVLRRLIGRRSGPRSDVGRAGPTDVAHRLAAAGTARAVTSFYAADPPRSSRRAPSGVPVPLGAPRERLVRDTGIALVALAILGLAVANLWPSGPFGRSPAGGPGVVRESQTPLPSAPPPTNGASTPSAGPSGVVLSETSAPSYAPTVTPTRTHRPAVTPKPTASAIAIPTPRLTPSPEPSPTSGPTPITSPTPTAPPTPPPTASPPEPSPS
jgi:hypothetical protein